MQLPELVGLHSDWFEPNWLRKMVSMEEAKHLIESKDLVDCEEHCLEIYPPGFGKDVVKVTELSN